MPASLSNLILSALYQTWGPASQSELAGQLELAENAVREYSQSLAQSSIGDPVVIQENISTFRATKYAEAITIHRVGRIPGEADAIAGAIISYLQNHGSGQYVPGSLVASPSGVVAPSPAGLPVSIIQYT
jgi:hypothetical protein